ncbi:MAG TPA: c-type cytochrome domain-containing protein [Verrucomicrobiae bacterium]|nr:c-type cytochrome domain-containing protein [Verrucomicrobiae bacterium]
MRLLLLLVLFTAAQTFGAVSFTNDIAPILAQKCIACHGERRAKGNFQLHTFDALIKGAKGERVIVAGKPEASSIYELLTSKDEDSRMPQNDDPLPAAQITLIKQWILEGAKFDGPDAQASIKTMVASVNFPDPPTAYPHPIPVLALAFNPAGSELASSGYHEVLIWDVADLRLIRRIRSLPQRIQALEYSPDGKLLAIASGTPGRIGQAYLAEGDNLRPLHTSPDVVLTVAFSPDGTTLATGGADNAIRLFEVTSGKLKFKTEQHADWVMGLAFHPETNLIVSASRDKTARVINTVSGELEATYQGHTEGVFAAVFSDDGRHAYSAGRDKKIHAWEIKDGKKTGETPVDGEIYRLVVRGKDLFACGSDKTVRQFRAADKPELLRTFSGHADVVYAIAFNPTAHRVASGGYDGEVRLWNTENGESIAAFKATPKLRSAQNLPQRLDTARVFGGRAD